jgi:hypothetical protein
MVTPGIEPCRDPWPCICSMSRLVFFSFFRCSSFDKKGGVGLFFCNWCSLTTPYSTWGHIKVGDIFILYIIHKTQTDTKFYYIQGHLSMQDSAAEQSSSLLWPNSKSESKSKSHCDCQSVGQSVSQSVSQSWCQAESGAHDQIFITVWELRSCYCGAPSLTRGRVCLLSESLSAVVSNLS